MNSEKLDLLIDSLEKQIGYQEISNPNISKANIGWHIDHSFKVLNQVILTLQASDPALYKNNFSFLGKIFFTLGFFPRGKAKAPKYVRPPETISKEDLLNQMKEVREGIITIPNLDKNAFFKHPMFGNINTTRVYRFLELHTSHHLKIIKEIKA
ncbi:DUF1569 domain-containing protein [Bizionia arctica]|uniref:DUF1569 domain-containing protein n=1 Tax=Bizionia arctica TaxID=1495645 RepID=A0A917GCV3_9FLAO|nr:DUF1569 domain-containing protein [Bizionia arctica]GGG38926.1 hypothetical protein GCM10010976_08370 [Bizionia arctica]